MTELVVPSDPKTRKALHNACKEISNSMLRKESEDDNIKAILERCKEEHGIPKGELKAVAKMFHKDSADEEEKKSEDRRELYDAIVEAGNSSSVPSDDTEE